MSGAIGLAPSDEVEIERVEANAFSIPTDRRESDGTLRWDRTTLVTVRLHAGGIEGIGYTYAAKASESIVRDELAEVVVGKDAMDVPRIWGAMLAKVRNLGRSGVAMMAISAIDAASWDLKSKLLNLPLARLLGSVRWQVPIYGSGGFTSYTEKELAEQLGGWARAGIRSVKMKVGRDPGEDVRRVRAARRAIGDGTLLFVDANGAYSRKDALKMAQCFAELDVRWFEEPVTSDDLEGLRLLRDRAPGGMDIAAGEYAFGTDDFARLLDAGAVDVLQADASRCGITGFLAAATLAEARHVDISAHCAPALHLHPSCSLPHLRHIEWFHDHVRLESLVFDGVRSPENGALSPDWSRPGMGIELKWADARRYLV